MAVKRSFKRPVLPLVSSFLTVIRRKENSASTMSHSKYGSDLFVPNYTNTTDESKGNVQREARPPSPGVIVSIITCGGTNRPHVCGPRDTAAQDTTKLSCPKAESESSPAYGAMRGWLSTGPCLQAVLVVTPGVWRTGSAPVSRGPRAHNKGPRDPKCQGCWEASLHR